VRTCARLGCREPVSRPNQRWCGDACRKAAGRDPMQGKIPKDWPQRSRAFWDGLAAILGRTPPRGTRTA
jgi:hypothetical protein